MPRLLKKEVTKRSYNCAITDVLKRHTLELYLTKQRTEKSLAAEYRVSCATIQFWRRKFAAKNTSEEATRPHASRPHASAAVAADASPTSEQTPPSAMAKKYEAPTNLPALNNFTIVSASYEVKNGRKVRKRRAHLRKQKR